MLLSSVHELLSDADRRAHYDETGELDEGGVGGGGGGDEMHQWEEYWRAMFPPVTVDAIEEFRRNYQNGEEERQDVLTAYQDNEGDMDAVVDSVMLAELVDIGRFVQSIILPAIKAGQVKRFKALKKFENRPVVELKPLGEQNSNASSSLVSIVRAQRQSASDGMIAHLERKYSSGNDKAKKSKKSKELPSDAEFAEIQARMEKNKRSKQ